MVGYYQCGSVCPAHLSNGLSLGQNVPEVPGPQHVPQRGGGQQLGRAAVVVHVGDGARGVLGPQHLSGYTVQLEASGFSPSPCTT